MKKYLLIAGFCLLPWLVHGGVYQWVDKDGRVHFGNIPPQMQDEYKAGKIKPQYEPVTLKKEITETELSEDGEAKQELPQKKSSPPALNKPEMPAESKDKISPKHQTTKFQNRKELKAFIEHLREKLKPSHEKKASSMIDKHPTKPKNEQSVNAQTLSPKPVNSAKAMVVKTADGIEPAVDEKVDEKKVPSKKNAKASEERTADAKSISSEKDRDKCGVFTDFVISYEAKVAEGCPGSHCSVYKGSLKTYKLKQKRYCLSE